MKYLIVSLAMFASVAFSAERELPIRIHSVNFDGKEFSAGYIANHGGDKHRAEVNVTFQIEEPTPSTLKTKVIATVTVQDFWSPDRGFDAPYGGTVKVDLAKLIREKLKEELRYNHLASDYMSDVEINLPSVKMPYRQ
jgi:hypothetical protein